MSLLSVTTSKAALIASILFVAYLLISSVISYRRLRQFKGPFLASISKLWLFKKTIAGQAYIAGADVLLEYGSPARIGPNLLLTDDPLLIRHMSAPRSEFTRGSWYDGFRLDPDQDSVFSTKDEQVHTKARAKLIHGYSGRELPNLEADVDARILELIELLQNLSKDHKPFDLSHIIQYFTMDILTDVAFGFPFGYVKKNEDIYEYNKSTREFVPILEVTLNHPWVGKILSSRVVQFLVGPAATDRLGMGAVMGVVQKVVAERYQPDAKARGDMLDSFIKHGLTISEAKAESLLQILAGADSTAASIRLTLLYIFMNPAIYNKLQKEIDSQTFAAEVVSCAEAKTMPYLQACLREGLRIYPPLQGLASKLSPPKGETVNGVFIPGGVEVAMSLLATQRRKDIFGEDALVFRPERWLEASIEDRHKMDQTWELLFGAGRYTCLGRNIALVELDKIFVELLRRFDWGIANPLEPIKSKCHAIHVQSNMFVTAKAR